MLHIRLGTRLMPHLRLSVRAYPSQRRMDVFSAPQVDFTWNPDMDNPIVSNSLESRQLLSDISATEDLASLLVLLNDGHDGHGGARLKPKAISRSLMKIASWLDEEEYPRTSLELSPPLHPLNEALVQAIHTLQRELVSNASLFQATTLADSLWALASIQNSIRGVKIEAGLLPAVDTWFVSSRPRGMVEKALYIHDILSLLWGCSSLYAALDEEVRVEIGHLAVIESLVREVRQRLTDVRSGSEMSHGDLIDVATSLSLLSQSAMTTTLDDVTASDLLDSLARELTRQLANRNSTSSSFLSCELATLMEALAGISKSRFFQTSLHRSADCGRLLDTIAGYISKRIRSNHGQMISQTCHIISVLKAYATIKHDSVAIPELISSLSASLMTSIAYRNMAQEESDWSGLASWLASPDWADFITVGEVREFLASWRELNFDPGPFAITSLLLALEPQQERINKADGTVIERELTILGYDPPSWL